MTTYWIRHRSGTEAGHVAVRAETSEEAAQIAREAGIMPVFVMGATPSLEAAIELLEIKRPPHNRGSFE